MSTQKRLLIFVLMVITPPIVYVGVSFYVNQRTSADTGYRSSALKADPPPPLPNPVVFTAINFNMLDRHTPPDDRPARMVALAHTLARYEPDFVLIQEAYIELERQNLYAALAGTPLAYEAYFPSGSVGSGLYVLSAHPIVEAYFTRYSANGKWYRIDQGDWWAGKGTALARLELKDEAGYLDLYNVDTIQRHGSDAYDDDRDIQLAEAAQFIADTRTGTAPAIVGGTFNYFGENDALKAFTGAANLGELFTRSQGVEHLYFVEDSGYDFTVTNIESFDLLVSNSGASFASPEHSGYVCTFTVTPADGAS